MKNFIAVLVAAALASQVLALPHGAHKQGRSMAVGPIIEEAGEGYESKRSMAVGPIIEEAGEGYES
jgi:hypothetical protein